MRKRYLEEIEYLKGLSGMVEAYEEIAAMRMQRIRDDVIYNREFMHGLNKAYWQVKYTYRKNNIKRGGKKAYVLISSNTGFYGDMIQKVFEFFRSDLLKDGGHPVVVGQQGKVLYEHYKVGREFSYFDLSDSEVDADNFKKLIRYLGEFETIVVYYGVFKNLIAQEAGSLNITGDDALPMEGYNEPKRQFFEPSLFEVLDYFDREIAVSLLLQTFYESLLAKFSGRISSLYEATDKIKKAQKQVMIEGEIARKSEMNKKQQAMLAWRMV